MDPQIAATLVVWAAIATVGWFIARRHRAIGLAILAVAGFLAVASLLSATGWGLHPS